MKIQWSVFVCVCVCVCVCACDHVPYTWAKHSHNLPAPSLCSKLVTTCTLYTPDERWCPKWAHPINNHCPERTMFQSLLVINLRLSLQRVLQWVIIGTDSLFIDHSWPTLSLDNADNVLRCTMITCACQQLIRLHCITTANPPVDTSIHMQPLCTGVHCLHWQESELLVMSDQWSY